MMKWPTQIIYGVVSGFLFFGVAQGEEGRGSDPVLMYADAAVMLAKYSGYFDHYVAEDADLNQCVSFLNQTGIYFGLSEVVSGAEFKVKDCARAMGQIDLVLNGDANFSFGKIRLPSFCESWSEYCDLNDVKFVEGYQTMVEMLRMAYIRRE